MKIKTLKRHRYGKSCATHIGAVVFDDNGHAEIKDEHFESLKTSMPDIVEVKEDAAAGTNASKTGDQTEDEMRLELKSLKLPELKEMASKIPGVDQKVIDSTTAKAPFIDIIIAEMFKDRTVAAAGTTTSATDEE